MTSRHNRLRHNVGSSWSEAEEEPDMEYVQYSSELESGSELDEDSDKELGRTRHNKATPPSSKSTRSVSGSSYKAPRSISNRNSEKMAQLKTPKNTPRGANSAHTTPRSEEPSFIMPSMNSPMDSYARGSPMPKPEVRMRKQRKSAEHNPANGSPRQPKHRISITDEPNPEKEEVSPWHYVFLFYQNFILPLVAYILDVVGYANRHFLKPILGLALGVGVLVLGIQFASSLLYSRLNAAIAPVCLIPGSSYVFSMCAVPEQAGQADFEELIKVQSHFEEVLDASKDTSTLPATLKDSEIAIRDLRTLVKHSRLPSRNQLDLEFHNFVLTAKEAANDLSRYNSRIGSALDRVIGTNTWTMAVLQGLEETEAYKGAVARVFNAVAGTFIAPSPTLEQRIFDQYVSHVSKNKDEITSLIEQAQALLTVLTNLDERLDTIFAITVNDDETISRSQDELLSSLWTKLGGNSASVKANTKNLNLLRDITQYRHKALKHVSETLLKLQEIQAELEGLREGVAAPEILGWRHGGLPIAYHVEMVERGVQRLRIVRGESEKVEREALRARLGGFDRDVKELGDGKAGPVVTVRAK